MNKSATHAAATPQAAGGLKGLTANTSLQLWLFAITLFSSALLLFAVQPMFAKMALPKLGGSPSVWAVSMCFFQTALLAGYCYAHALNRFLAPRQAVLVHVTLLVITVFALPIGLPSSLGEPPAGDAYLWLTGVLLLGVGLPFFAVSASAPLLQSWFSRTGHPAARDPYFLYGASNIGSLLALLAYPLAVEPLFGAIAQSRIWSFSFLLLAALIALCGMLMIRLQGTIAADASKEDATAAIDNSTAPIDWSMRGLWILLAALPSGLMVAVTTYVTTDVASAPFLWVVPLAMFLGTFILVFKDKVSPRFELLAVALPVSVLACLVAPNRGSRMTLAMAAFFMAALVCHRELYQRRPHARHLTEFYLWMSAGGVIGGVFAALIAPQIFTSTYEFTVLLAASLLCVPGLMFGKSATYSKNRIIGLTGAVALCVIASILATELAGRQGQILTVCAVAIGASILLLKTQAWAERKLAVMMSIATMALVMPEQFHAVYAERSFFGTVRVIDLGDMRLMLHGTTLHGVRRVKTDDGEAIAHPSPISYFHPSSPLARGFGVARSAKAATTAATVDSTRMTVGIIGLGTGTLACYAKPGDNFRFYEIDPLVAKAASNVKHFDFLAKCTPNAPMIIGDARLKLNHEPNNLYDYLVIDAFSSDSVPVHLMTVEAMKLYFDKITPNGVLALHISNMFLDLPSAVSATVGQIPGVHGTLIRYEPAETDKDALPSHVVLLSRDEKVIANVRNTWSDAKALERTDMRPWTDDYSNIVTAIWRMLWK
jgi:uncharacterized membrane protein